MEFFTRTVWQVESGLVLFVLVGKWVRSRELWVGGLGDLGKKWQWLVGPRQKEELAQVACDTGLRSSGSLLVELRCFWLCSCSDSNPAFTRLSYSLASSFISHSAVVFCYCFVLSLLSDIVSQFCLCFSSLRILRFKPITRKIACVWAPLLRCVVYTHTCRGCCRSGKCARLYSWKWFCIFFWFCFPFLEQKQTQLTVQVKLVCPSAQDSGNEDEVTIERIAVR